MLRPRYSVTTEADEPRKRSVDVVDNRDLLGSGHCLPPLGCRVVATERTTANRPGGRRTPRRSSARGAANASNSASASLVRLRGPPTGRDLRNAWRSLARAPTCGLRWNRARCYASPLRSGSPGPLTSGPATRGAAPDRTRTSWYSTRPQPAGKSSRISRSRSRSALIRRPTSRRHSAARSGRGGTPPQRAHRAPAVHAVARRGQRDHSQDQEQHQHLHGSSMVRIGLVADSQFAESGLVWSAGSVHAASRGCSASGDPTTGAASPRPSPTGSGCSSSTAGCLCRPGCRPSASSRPRSTSAARPSPRPTTRCAPRASCAAVVGRAAGPPLIRAAPAPRRRSPPGDPDAVRPRARRAARTLGPAAAGGGRGRP